MTMFRYYAASTLDGFIADPDDGIGWLMAFGMDEYAGSYERLMSATGAIVMGSHTYEFILGEGEWSYGALPAWVFTSRELPAVEGGDIRFVSGSLPDAIGRIRDSANGKDVWIVGGGELAGRFAQAGALDEIVVTLMPVLLGAGKPLFSTPVQTRALELTASQTYPSGAVELTYSVS